MRATVGSRCSDGLEAVPVSESPPRSRDAGRVVSKSDTKDASRSSGLQRNRGIMRFHFARFSPAQSFVSNLDIGSAAGAVSATARRRFPIRNPDRTWARHPTSLSRVAGSPAGPILCCAAGDIPRGWVRSAPGGGIRRRQGQKSGPPTREMPPAGRKSPRPCRMSPLAARRRPEVCPGPGPGCVQLRPESAPVQARACSQARTARTRRFSSPGCRSSPRKMFATCLATAPSETTSRSAICAFDSP